MTTVQITVTVNGEEQTAEVEPRLLLGTTSAVCSSPLTVTVI